MSRSKLLVAGLCLLLTCALWVPQAHADQWNQATKLTFNQPVEIPGRVLAAGTYWFTLTQGDTDRNLVEIWNNDRQHLVTTVMTIPDMRMHHIGRISIKFEREHPTGTPEALRAWFYPGDSYGHEFVYPESQARKIAKETGRPVLSMRDDVAAKGDKPIQSVSDPGAVAMKNAQISAINPQGQRVDKSEAMEPANNNQTAVNH